MNLCSLADSEKNGSLINKMNIRHVHYEVFIMRCLHITTTTLQLIQKIPQNERGEGVTKVDSVVRGLAILSSPRFHGDVACD